MITEADSNNKHEESVEEGVAVSSKLLWLLAAGFAVFFVGIVILIVASVSYGGSSSVGGVIFIGPIPIVFGAGPDAFWLILLGVIIAIVSFVLFVIMRRRR